MSKYTNTFGLANTMNHHNVHPINQGNAVHCEMPYQATSQSIITATATSASDLQEQHLVSQGFVNQSESVACGPPMSYQGHQVYNQCQQLQHQQQLSTLNNQPQQLYMTHQYQLNDVTSYSVPQGSVHHHEPQQHQSLPLDSRAVAYEPQLHFIQPPLAGTENQYDESTIHITRPTDQLYHHRPDYTHYNSLVMDQPTHHDHPYQRMVQYQSHQNMMTSTHQAANSFPETMLDQSQAYQAQNQMDLYPTIKQQEQQQQHHHHSNNIGVSASVDTVQPVRVRGYEHMMNMYTHRNLDPSSAPDLIQQPQRSKPDRELVSSVEIPYGSRGLENPVQRVVPQPARARATAPPQRTSLTASLSSQQKQQQQDTSAAVQLQQPCDQQQSAGQQQRQENFLDIRASGNAHQDWLDTICRHLIEHLDRFGICVIDNFLGSLRGDSILKEVKQLYSSGRYVRGKLVGNKLASRTLGSDTGVIRNDRVIWIDGFEDGCLEINNLIQTLCSVITNSSRLSLYSNNGLDKMVINKRTKAHVACYPGNGTRYIKHVDNPNGDGRVITSIYYLNKDWVTKRDGGLLRMFPVGINEVANIEPLFDRVLFFWSDRRNPHEVLPAFKDRFAITVWYIGESRS